MAIAMGFAGLLDSGGGAGCTRARRLDFVYIMGDFFAIGEGWT